MRVLNWARIGSLLLCGGGLMIGAVAAQGSGPETTAPAAKENTPEAEAVAPVALSGGVVRTGSRIVQVTVYSDRALVTRRASLQLRAGESRVVFDRLPSALDANSLQVEGRGKGAIKGVNLELIPAAGAEDEDTRRLVAKKRQLEARVQGVQDTVAEAKQEKSFVEAIAKRLTTASEKSEQAELDPKKWIEMVAFYRRRLAALDQEIRSESDMLAPLQEDLQKVEEELQNLNRDLGGGKYRAEVVADMSEAGPLTLELTYVVIGPRWYPHYDLRADSKNAKLQAEYQGVVFQSTGEDWKQVELTLSTAQPRAGAQHPELQPWRVEAYREPPVAYAPSKRQLSRAKMQSAAPAMASAQAYDEMEAAPAPEPVMEVAQAAVQNQASAVVFTAAGKQTVAGNNQPHRVTVAVLEFPAVFRYSAVPKLVANAFLQAKITNASKYPLLAGPTSIFLDNAFVANGSLNTVAPGEEFESFLGVDEGIKVEHKLIQRQEQKEGVFGGRVKWLYEYRIKLTSHKAQTHDLVVRDQVPIPGNNEIQIELLQPTVKGGDDKLTKDDLNLLEWRFRIEPGQVIEIPLKFTVSYPKEMKVSGL